MSSNKVPHFIQLNFFPDEKQNKRTLHRQFVVQIVLMTQLIVQQQSVKALLTVTKISFSGLFAGETNILPVCYELIDVYSFSVTSLILSTQSMRQAKFQLMKVKNNHRSSRANISWRGPIDRRTCKKC